MSGERACEKKVLIENEVVTQLGMHCANSHHLGDAETVPEVVEWIASVVLLYSNLQQVEQTKIESSRGS